LVTVPPGPHILSDILVSSPIITGEENSSGMGGVTTTASDFGTYGGVDPNLEPELALALKVSLEEERARQEEARKKAEMESKETKPISTENTNSSSPPPSQITTTEPPVSKEVEMTELDDDELKQAFALSMEQSSITPSVSTSSPSVSTPPTSNTSQEIQMEDDYDSEMRLALEMSLGESTISAPKVNSISTASEGDINKELMEDPNFVNSILMTLPGVDPDDERIKNALKQLEKKDKENK